jgi:hypothetical protein
MAEKTYNVQNIKYIYWKMVRFKRLYEIKKDTGLQIGIKLWIK